MAAKVMITELGTYELHRVCP